MSIPSTKGFEKKYSESGFWNKVTKYAKTAGEICLNPALLMYYAYQKPETPVWAKSTIIAALGYFIFPIDAVPDIIPVVGYADDAAVLAAALGVVASYIDKDVKAKAKKKLKDWFE